MISMKIAVTIMVAAVGGLIGYRMKIPAGAMIGAMISVAVFNIAWGNAYIPVKFKVFAQILTGGIIGLSFSRDTLMQIKELLLPLTVSVALMMSFCVVLGILLYKFTDLDIITAMFALSPGGITDMTLAAQDMGGETSIIAVFHFIRLSLVVGFMPVIIRTLSFMIDK